MRQQSDKDQGPIRIGISTCLLGEKVRFDKGHKRDALIVESLGQFFSWTPACPEMEIGLGTPRESLRLIGDVAMPRLIAPKSQSDYTEAMQQFANTRLTQLEDLELHGYILKKDSPSCGMARVRVYGEGGIPQRHGQGLFARAGCDQRSLVTLIPQLELVAALDAIAKTRPTSGSLVRPAGLT
jgi:uncharacterized protein YbbK (DUF523 family)